MCTRQSGLGQQYPRGSFLGVGERDVQAHAPGADGPDLDVDTRPGLAHTLERDLHVPDELRKIESREVPLYGLAVQNTVLRFGTEFGGGGERILVGQRPGRVHAVHDHVGTHPGKQAAECRALEHRLSERPEQVVHHSTASFGIPENVFSRSLTDVVRDKEVAPGRLYRGVVGSTFIFELTNRLLGLRTVKRRDAEPFRGVLDHSAGYGEPHEAGPSQDEHRSISQFHLYPSCLGSLLLLANAFDESFEDLDVFVAQCLPLAQR